MSESNYEVLITDEGRSGSVEYREGDLVLPLWWEFTMDGAWIWAPSPEQWDAYWAANGAAAAAGRRDEILGRVGAETVRKRASSGKSKVGSDGVHIRF